MVKISVDYSRLKTRFEHNESRDREERERTEKRFVTLEEKAKEERCKCDAKFSELYNSRNKTNDVLTELSTTVKMLVQNLDTRFTSLEDKINTQLNTLDKKVDELKERRS